MNDSMLKLNPNKTELILTVVKTQRDKFLNDIPIELMTQNSSFGPLLEIKRLLLLSRAWHGRNEFD